MKIPFLFCSLVLTAAFAQGQEPPAQPVQPTSPNQGGPQMMSLRVAGSSVVDMNGQMSGNVESVVIDPRTGQVQFAMVSSEYPANRLNVTPVPWQLLQYRSSGGIPGTFQQLSLPMTQSAFLRAPRVSSEQQGAANDLGWMNASYNYFQTAAAGNTGAGGAAFTPFASGGTNTLSQNQLNRGTNQFGAGFGTNALAGGVARTNLAGENHYTPTNAFGSFGSRTNLLPGNAASGLFPGNTAASTPNAQPNQPNQPNQTGNPSGFVPTAPPVDVGAPPSDSGVSTQPGIPAQSPPQKAPLTRPAAPAAAPRR